MWVFLQIISLLIRATVGSPGTDTLSDVTQLENGSDDMLDNRTGKSAVDPSNEWKGGSFEAEGKRKQTDPSIIKSDGPEENNNFDNSQNVQSIEYDRGLDSNLKTVTKRRETVGSWLDLPSKDKDLSEEKKGRWIYWWGDKRISLYGPSPSIRRPIRVPFNSWGGKRGKTYSRSNVLARAKRDKLAYDRNDRDTFVDGYDIKRMAESGRVGWKTPFNSWGGKRATKTIDRKPDRERFVLAMMEPNPNDARIFSSLKGVFTKGGNIGKTVDERNTVQRMSKIRRTFDRWNEKRNDFPYRIPLRVNNKTSENDYTMEEEIADNNNNNDDDDDDDNDNDNDWIMSMADKRHEQELFKKKAFDPWGGKRSSKTYAFRFGDEYFEVPAHSA